MRRKQQAPQRDPFCHFCVKGTKDIDYKNTQLLGRFLSNYSKILPRRRMGVCMKHQRILSQSVKRARFMALIPYTTR